MRMENDAETAIRGESPRASVVRTIRKWIEDGSLERGVPLPSERELCKKLGTSQRSVQKAFEILEGEKLVVRKGLRTRIIPEAKAAREKGMLSESVVILSHDLAPSAFHGSGWTDAILKGMLNSLGETGFHAFNVNPRKLLSQLDGLLKQTPAGMLIVDILASSPDGLPDKDTLERILASGVPLVVYGDDPQYQGLDRVSSDHCEGSRLLAKALLERGRKKIVMSWQGELDRYWFKARVEGYETAMREAGLAPMPPIVEVEFKPKTPSLQKEFDAGAKYHAGYLADYVSSNGRPDAIMTLSDSCVYSFASACETLGLKPGDDLDIVGYDNYWSECPERSMADYVPPLTVDKLNVEMGMAMTKLLTDRRSGALPPEPQLKLLKPRLVSITA